MMNVQRFVIDTDVVIAGLRSPSGASARLLRHILDGEAGLFASVAMVLEYEAVATRQQHLAASGLGRDDVLAVIDALAAVAEPVIPAFLWRPQLRDPNDEMLLEAAINAGGAPVVTFNTAHFMPAAARFGVDLLKPAEALWRIRNG